MGYKTLEAFPAKKTCQFCQSRKADEYELGEIVNIADIYVHYFCLLLSSEVKQRGQDHQGILGFLPHDIKKELSRGKSLLCEFCKKKNATLKCSHPGCKKNFHLPCGLRRGTVHHFYNLFKSFCITHRPKQKIPDSVLFGARRCPICLETVDATVVNGTVWPTCCKPPGELLHRKCLAKMAKSHGLYHFKCPLCNDKNKFLKEIQRLGFYIPERDPKWELEPRAFQEMYTREIECSAGTNCLCTKGPLFNKQGGRWQIEPCHLCGHTGIHLGCSNMWTPGSGFSLQWECSLCQSVLTTERTSASNEPIFCTEFESLNDVTEQSNRYLAVDPLGLDVSQEEEVDVCGDVSPPSLWPTIETIDMTNDEINDDELPESATPYLPVDSHQAVSTIRYAVGLPIIIDDSDDEIIVLSDDEG